MLERSFDWSMTITEGTVYLSVNGDTLETPIHVKAGTLSAG